MPTRRNAGRFPVSGRIRGAEYGPSVRFSIRNCEKEVAADRITEPEKGGENMQMNSMQSRMKKVFLLLTAFMFVCTLQLPSADAERTAAGGTELSAEEQTALFTGLSEMYFLASSGVGAWESELMIDSTGGFTGNYRDADADADVEYEVSFSGTLTGVYRTGETTYTMTVKDVSTQEVPGTVVENDWGGHTHYVDSLFQEGSRLLLTLPGTPDEEIPETVRGEIGGTFWEWEDYSAYSTLTREEDGWGFFSEDEYTPVELSAPSATPIPITFFFRTPAPSDAPAAPASVQAAQWAGFWATKDDLLSELVITDTGAGTMHAQVSFLRTMNMEAVLTPQADGSLLFDANQGILKGILSRQADGTLSLVINGGSSYEDEEATEHQYYFSRRFVYSPAAYEEMWYEKPEEKEPEESDWIGEWTAQRNGRTVSVFRIEPSEYGPTMRIFFDNGCSYTGELETSDGKVMDFYCDDFNCMMTLNRKQHAILMEEIGSMDNRIYDWLEQFPYGVVEYTRQNPKQTGTGGSIPETAAPTEVRAPLLITLQPEPSPAAPTEEPELPPDDGDPGYWEVPVSRVNATSYIVGKNPYAYTPQKMIDGDETTAFQFSTKTTPVGEMRLHFYFDSPVAVDELWMKNGFWKTTDGNDQYTRNCRVKKMTIFVQRAGSDSYKQLKSVTLNDDGRDHGWTVIDMQGQTEVTSVRIRIDSVYKGSKYKNDVCISEVMFVNTSGQD